MNNLIEITMLVDAGMTLIVSTFVIIKLVHYIESL